LPVPVDDLLDTAKIEAGRTTLDKWSVSCATTSKRCAPARRLKG